MHFSDEIGPKLNQDFLQSVLDRYNQGQIQSWNPFLSGWTNVNVHLKTSSGEFILRLYRHKSRTFEDINLEIKVLEHLLRKGLPVAKSFSDSTGHSIIKVSLADRTLYATLFSYVGGEIHPYPSVDEIEKIGQALAKIHLALTDFQPSHTKKYFRLKHEVLRLSVRIKKRAEGEWFYPKVIDQKDFLSWWKEDLQYFLKLDELSHHKLRATSIIHGDLHPGNLKFEGSDISGIFDFDNLMHAPRILDPAITLAQFKFWHAKLLQETLDEAKKPLLAGYGKLVKLSPWEEKTILDLARFWLWKQVGWTLKAPETYDQHSHQEFFLQASLAGIKELQDLRLKQ